MTLPTTGNVAQQPLGPLVYSLAASKLDGALALEHEGRRYSLWYKGGLIVDAESPAPDDQLGRVLLQAGLLSNAQVGESIRRLAQGPNRRQLDILVEMGALQGEMIDRAALLGLVRRAVRLFSLPTASYAIQAAQHDRRGGGPIDCRWVLYRGVRQYFDEKRLDRELTALQGEAVKLGAGMEPYLEAFGFADEERIVLGYLGKGYWELPDLLEACVSLPRPVMLSVMYALWSSGCLDAQPAETVPRLRKRAREMTEQVARPSMPPMTRSSYVQAAGVRKEMLFEGSAQPAQPPRAEPPKRPTGPAPEPPKRPSGPGPDPKLLTGAMPGLREQILRKFTSIEQGADHFTVLEIDRGASKEQVKAQYFSLAKTYHPDRLAIVKLEELRPQVDRIFSSLSEAFAALGDDAKRREYLDVLARGGEAAIRRREDDDAAKAAKLIGAEEQFRMGEMLLRRQLWSQALEAFKKAIDLNPEEAEHHALYHWTVWCAAAKKEPVANEVKKGLQRAMELNPRCVPAAYYLGQVHNLLGDQERAYRMFQRVLELQPEHVDAEREVRVIEMRRKKKR